MSDPRFPPDDPDGPLCGGDPLARALARLAPAPADLATPVFLFAAGRAAEGRRVAFWQRLCLGQTALGCAAAAVVAVWAASPADRPGERGPVSGVVAGSPAEVELAPPPREVFPPSAVPVEPTGFAVKPTGDEPTLEERIRWLRLRNDVLAAGLTMLPEAVPPPRPPDGFEDFPVLGRGVFATPPRPPPPPPVPEDDR